METFYLYKSDRPEKKFVMIMPTYKHKHYFGSSKHRDFTLMNNKNSKFFEPNKVIRNQVKNAYLQRHAKHKKGIHSASSMSDINLWSKPTLKQGIKAFEKKFKVKIVFSNKVYNDKL